MKKLLLAISILSGTVVYAVTPPHQGTNLKSIISPSCTHTVSATSVASVTCNGEITIYSVTSSCTATDSDCGLAYAAARACAQVKAQHQLRKVLVLLPPCDETGPPQP